MNTPESLWQATAILPKFPQLNTHIKTDVLVIGGGLAGLLTAYMLKEKGISCILVEKGRIMGGVSGNTTAKITIQHGLIYHKLLKNAGFEKATLYMRANRQALEKYAKLCKNIDCRFEEKDNYVYSADDRKKLEDELEAMQKIGLLAHFQKTLPIPIETVGAVKLSNQAQFHPVKFAANIAKGLDIYENSFVREVADTTVITDKGKIQAEKIVAATHFPFINNHGGYFLKLYQHRSYVIALENAEQYEGMYVDDKKKGMSFRNYGKLLLIGGGDHRTGKKGGNWKELRSFAKAYYPKSAEKYFWAAQDCMSLDEVPYIGRYSKRTPNIYVASGFNKWGVTGSMVAAEILSDMISGKENDFAAAFNPSRSILKPQLFLNGLETAKSFVTPTKKRCPHLGCALKWNSAEHSWDCSCHGSRFSENGKVLDNPANGNLN